MDAERWQEVEQLLDAVLDLPPEERTAYLDEACHGDDALRAEVEALLDAEANAPPFLEENAAAMAASLILSAAPSAEAPASASGTAAGGGASGGEKIGPYRLVEEIGRGGMSVVYLAERADGHFKQQVALKLLPRHFETESRLARFRAERQILAQLDHPNIARLLDGGVTDTGRPYLVMEHVEGRPITDYCAERQCSIAERVHLLRTVCEAVQHAHRRLVVHRDLKPSNILVSEMEEGPRVKLLDFGIAKLLDEEATPVTAPLTRTGERLLTPEYAAPEQIKGEAITTATDVYQLGVLAYELLCGQRPFRVDSRSLSEIEQAVLETTPDKPSAAVTQSARERTHDRTRRSTRARPLSVSPRAWSRRLEGDLDTIVLKALRKEPGRRYASARELADDLRRYLDGRPVEARPLTWRYRARKFVQRHRGGIALVLVVLALLTGAFAAAIHQRDVALEERDRATQEAARAAEEAHKAEQVSEFLITLFEASNPDEARGETVTARDLLERGVARAAALDDQPAVQAQMFQAIGEVHRSHGNYARAGDLLERALQIRRPLYPGAHPDLAHNLRVLGELRKDEGDFEAADSLFQAATAMLRTLHEGPHPDLATAISDRATLKSQQGAYRTAEALAREALEMRRALLSPPDKALATSLNNLAAVYYRMNEYEKAAPLYEESLAMHRELLGDDHPHIAALLNNLANLYLGMSQFNQSVDRYDEAETYRREALALDRKLFGPQHRYVSTDLASLGSILSGKGQYEEAEALLREAVAMQRAVLGDDHPDVAIALDQLGRVLSKQGAYAEAEAVLHESLAIRDAHFDEVHPRRANTLNTLGDIYTFTSRYEQAEAQYREAIAIQRETVGASSNKVALFLNNLAGVLHTVEDWPAAEATYREALDMYRHQPSPDTLSTAEMHVGLGEVLLQQGAFEEAEIHLQNGRGLLQAIGREEHAAMQRATAALTLLHEPSLTR